MTLPQFLGPELTLCVIWLLIAVAVLFATMALEKLKEVFFE